MFGFFAVILGPLMRLVYNFVPNFALALIVFTVIVRVVTLPLAINQQKSMAKMSVFQPMMNEIQQKYKNNQQKQQEELMRLQTEYGFNPMAGCLPMLIDFMILFGIIEVVYRPVQYILAIPADTIKLACEELAIDTARINTMQTTLIQMIHDGAASSVLSADQYERIANFNTMFLGMDMCDIPGFRISPLVVFPILAAALMIGSNMLMQKISGTGAQMQGQMKLMMYMMNAMFIFYCFSAPCGFSVYYGTSSLCMVLRQLFTYKLYSPEKFKAEYEEQLAAKKAASKKKHTVTVQENGKNVTKNVSNNEMARLRLERARQLEEEKYAGARTQPLTNAEREALEAAKPQKKGLFK